MKKVSYGFDAPVVIRNLFLGSLGLFLITGLAFFIKSQLWFWVAFIYLFVTALSFFIMAVWTLYSSLYLKPKLISKLIEDLELTGCEAVLDMGCGSGMFLIEAAKQLPRGKACGIDLWLNRDQFNNKIENTLSNAEVEGVQIELKTADMCRIPYRDKSFDCVISSLAIHNISDKVNRDEALSEMLRVLKPGGKFIIMDISPAKSYFEFLNEKDNVIVQTPNTIHKYCPPVYVIKGKVALQKESGKLYEEAALC
jgi:ubiquinone/menaquinone biosynthesis C-methylase UbiE